MRPAAIFLRMRCTLQADVKVRFIHDVAVALCFLLPDNSGRQVHNSNSGVQRVPPLAHRRKPARL
ncbi:hypothetical protein BL250_13860 [Erwinia sp. OLTSP20]|nr:hypothetical protein BV501_09760 [Erwinia sp. OAMSP11]PIJ72174.1 hypothetical protein BK416_10650 [Erwinia sp. OLSSP12]PIJ81465.1 hypothetical protein BLD47_09475 [Erwinia sp. OLCASP19]PIJ84171.1 hypothetical protein BLD46_09055 [Erwinia sp. OLMTSP26]PIJ85870.1 hypothetical protein BLD49_10275 [Erwinia sp. OLMDSP33]PIJ90510.1 hypothetical protein BL250_13860 [Erwinia sp. OLTSP20]PIJ92058.1 hypothetical protein BL249_07415 [Erwinia sp. OLFS4]